MGSHCRIVDRQEAALIQYDFIQLELRESTLAGSSYSPWQFEKFLAERGGEDHLGQSSESKQTLATDSPCNTSIG
jgi:hypothetical protein